MPARRRRSTGRIARLTAVALALPFTFLSAVPEHVHSGGRRAAVAAGRSVPPTVLREVRILRGREGAHCLAAGVPAGAYEVSIVDTPAAAIVGEVWLSGGCLHFAGVRVGKTGGVLERCHASNGPCERYAITFEVLAEAPPPAPVDDYAAIAHNGQGLISVLGNDALVGEVASVIISGAPGGRAHVDARYRIHYSAPEGWCGRDSLRYVVCTEGGCGEAGVRIEVSCERLIVFSGFSPNGDGVNDAFTVLGIEGYPDNRVWVFDEYGHEVFRAEGYVNDWEGRAGEAYLTEGTYYYVVEVEGARTLSGYVQLER